MASIREQLIAEMGAAGGRLLNTGTGAATLPTALESAAATEKPGVQTPSVREQLIADLEQGGVGLLLPTATDRSRPGGVKLPTYSGIGRRGGMTGAALPKKTAIGTARRQTGQPARASDLIQQAARTQDAELDRLREQRSLLLRAQGNRYDGAWLSQADMLPGETAADALKRVEEELDRLDQGRGELGAAYYVQENEEQFSALDRDKNARAAYDRAKSVEGTDYLIQRTLDALNSGAGPEVWQSGADELEKLYGISPASSGSLAQYMNDLTALLGKQPETLEELAGQLKTGGFDYGRMTGYEEMKQDAARYAGKQEDRVRFAQEHPVISSAATVAASPFQGAEFLDLLGRGIGKSDERDFKNYVPANPYRMEATNFVNTVRGTVAQGIEDSTNLEVAGQNVASFLYQTGMSVLDSAAMVSTMGSAATLFMGGNAAASQAQDIMARGGTNRQAFAGGIAAGAAEAVFEKFSIDHLLSAKTVGSAGDLLRETLKQAGVEASEETFTEIANILSDAAVMGGSSGFHLAVRDYMAQGMSEKEARKRAYLDMVGQVAWAGAGGALSGAAMGGVVNTKNYIRQNGALPGGRITPQNAVSSVNERLSQPGQVAQDMGGTETAPDGVRTEGPTDSFAEKIGEMEGKAAQAEHTLETERAIYRNLYAEYRSTENGYRRPELLDEAQNQMNRVKAAEKALADIQKEIGAEKEARMREEEAVRRRAEQREEAVRRRAEQREKAQQVVQLLERFQNRPANEAAIQQLEQIGVDGKRIHAMREAYKRAEFAQKQVNTLRKRMHNSESITESIQIKEALERADKKLDARCAELVKLQTGIYQSAASMAKGTDVDRAPAGQGVKGQEARTEGEINLPRPGEPQTEGYLPRGTETGSSADSRKSQLQGTWKNSGWAEYWDGVMGDVRGLPTVEETGSGYGDGLTGDVRGLPTVEETGSGYGDGLTGDVRGLPTVDESGSGTDNRTEREKAMWEEAKRKKAEAGDSRPGYRGTPATDKLGIKVERPITDLGQSQSLRGLEKARYQAGQELNRVLKESHATKAERSFAQGVADGIYSIRQIPPGMSVETVQNIADAYRLRDSLSGKTNDAKARTNWDFDSVVRQLTAESDNWTAPGVLSLNANTMQRNVERMVGRKAAKEFNAEFFDPVVTNEAERIRFVNRMLEQMEGYRLNADESGMVQKLMEGEVSEGELKAQGYDAQRLAEAAKTLSGMYAGFYEAINDFLVAHGYKEIGWQKNYAPHMQEEQVNTLQKYLQRLGFQTQVTELPTELAGRTDAFRPGKQYDPYFQHRRGKETVYDAVGGLESYVNYLSNVFYHTDDVQKLRRLSEGLRTKYSAEELGAELDRLNNLQDQLVLEDTDLLGEDSIQDLKEKAYERFGKMTKLGGFVSVLDDYANILAGKQSKFDRAVESLIGRTGLNWGRNIQNAFARAAIVGNLSSAINQTVQIPQLVAEVGPKYTMQAVADVVTGVTGKTGFNQESDFITGKRGIQSISEQTGSERFFDVAAKPFEVVDDFASRVIVRAKYLEQVARGMSHEEALKAADQFASRLVGSRMKGAKPVLFEQKNPFSKLVTTFQLEVANGWEHIVHDLPAEIQEIAQTKGKGAAVKRTAGLLAATQIAAFIGNVIIKSLTGREPVPFDGLGMLANYLASGYGMTKEEYMAAVADSGAEAVTGERPLGTERPDGKFDYTGALKTAGEDALEDIPFVSNITSMLGITDGRLPMPQVWNSQLTRGAKGLMTAAELEDESEREEAVKQGLASMGGGAVDVLATWLPLGSQIKKTGRGAEALARGGAYVGYGDNEALQYPIEGTPANWARGLLFGKSALPETDAYYAEGAKKLSVGQTEVYHQLLEHGAEGQDAYQTIQDLRKEKKTDGKLSVLQAADLTDEQKMILYRGMVKDNKDDDIAAAIESGLPFDSFLEADSVYYEINKREELNAGEKATEFARWLNGQGFTDQQYKALREAFPFLSHIPASETSYEKFVTAGMPDELAYSVAEQMAGLEPLPGKTQVSSLQKSRVIVDSQASAEQKLAALAVVMDEGEYIKTETAYDYNVLPEIYVTYKEQVAGLSKQEDIEHVLRGLLLTTEQRAALWQLQDAAWKPYRNPFDTNVSQSVLDAYSTRKRGGFPSYEELQAGRGNSGFPSHEELQTGRQGSVKGLPTYEELMASQNR